MFHDIDKDSNGLLEQTEVANYIVKLLLKKAYKAPYMKKLNEL